MLVNHYHGLLPISYVIITLYKAVLEGWSSVNVVHLYILVIIKALQAHGTPTQLFSLCLISPLLRTVWGV